MLSEVEAWACPSHPFAPPGYAREPRVALSAVLLARSSLWGAAPITHSKHAHGRAHGALFIPCGKHCE